MFNNIPSHASFGITTRNKQTEKTGLKGPCTYLAWNSTEQTTGLAERETKELIKRRAFRSDWLLFTGEGAWGAGGQGAGESRESGRSDSSPPLPSLTAFNYLPNNKNEQLSQWFRENPLKVIRFIDLL